MGINTPNPEQYGVLTNWSKEVPVASTVGWAIHHVRNLVFKLPLLNMVEGVAHKTI